MAVTSFMYSHFPYTLITDKFGDLSSETLLKCMLCTSTYTPSQDNHDYKDDIDAEVSGTGYTAGGAIITTTNPTISANVTTFDAADTEWTTSTITARYAVIYDYSSTGADSTKPLVAYIDFGEDKSSEAGTFKIAWNASGIFTITCAT